MKYELMSLKILVPVENADRIKENLFQWLSGHKYDLDWMDINSTILDTNNLPDQGLRDDQLPL